MDGYTSAALLINYIRMQQKYGDWVDCSPEIIHILHTGKIHGLDDTEVMDKVLNTIKPDLFVIPDASGNNKQYQALTSAGIDVVVLDHHDMSERGDGEKVIVVNNQQSSRYKNKDLSGVGVVYQLCRVFDDMLSFVCADNYLDIVALGLVSDVMDLRSAETRFLVFEGLKPENLRSYYLEYAKFANYKIQNVDLTPHIVSFYVAPLFNAVNRIGSMEEKELVFRSLLDDDSRMKVQDGARGHTGEVDLVVEMTRQANNCKSRQKRRVDKLVALIHDLVSEEKLYEKKVILLAIDDFDKEWRALTGLVAGSMADYYQRPCILTFLGDDGAYYGSLRCPNNMPAFEHFKDDCNASKLIKYASGHQQAAGIAFEADAVKALEKYFEQKYADVDTSTAYMVDFIIDAEDPELPDIITELADYSNYWGQGIKEPLIAITNVKIAQSTLSLVGPKKNTLKIQLPHDCVAISFSSSPEEYDSLCLPYDGQTEQYYVGTVIGYDAELNTFRYQTTPQVKIKDYAVVDTKYDF